MRAWYVVHTHVNGEARALGHLQRQGYDAYLPHCERRRSHAGKVETVRRPLFPRYLFVRLDLEMRRWRPILSTVGVCNIVRRGEIPAPVPAGVVEEIRQRELAGAFSPSHAVRSLCKGDPVRFTGGAFADLVGRFLGLGEKERIQVLISLLGRQLRTEVHMDDVLPA